MTEARARSAARKVDLAKIETAASPSRPPREPAPQRSKRALDRDSRRPDGRGGSGRAELCPGASRGRRSGRAAAASRAVSVARAGKAQVRTNQEKAFDLAF